MHATQCVLMETIKMHVTQCVLMETIKGSGAILFALANKNACDPCVLMETIKGSGAILFALANKNACDLVCADGNYKRIRSIFICFKCM